MKRSKGKNKIRIGGGAGFSGDRVDSAVELAAKSELDYIVLECLAERTVALGNMIKIREPGKGYSETLSARIRTLLPVCLPKGVRIISNMGSANPLAAGKRTYEIARELGFPEMQVAVVLGDDVLDIIKNKPELILLESGKTLESILPRIISANAYMGADAIVPALETGQAVVLTGRVADPSLFLAPMIHEFNWSYNDYKLLAQGTLAGHLLECAGQLTGGYFADPGKKNVPGLARLGFPYADVTKDGKVTLGKTPETGGKLDVMTCKEQLLYEIHDPSRYITPDCVLDVTDVNFKQEAKDSVHAFGARALARTDSYKVSVGYMDGYMGEGQISYGGPNAVARARLAGEIVIERLKIRKFDYLEIHKDFIGMDSLHGKTSTLSEPYEVRLRLAAKCRDKMAANAVGEEVEALLTNGPAGGGGFFRQTKELVAIQSVLLPRYLIKQTIHTIGK
ncbi:acyclic terpene utilization AtuA family protein [Desulfobacula sp.]|uniref:acyclic terpene utilization AtuA family protein n=1 Tax=Desulfobacula sp. TaxID=2593537 RepID=UPI00260DEB09|nr:acyclic terpene utilization AtuA family protein [Desulfobacula sp.]